MSTRAEDNKSKRQMVLKGDQASTKWTVEMV